MPWTIPKSALVVATQPPVPTMDETTKSATAEAPVKPADTLARLPSDRTAPRTPRAPDE
jgi:hypothetical protein